MQDKEFDKLFRQRFESFESEPSEVVWNSVNSELKKNSKRKSGIGFYWMAAASVILILGAAIWFAPQEEKVWLQNEESGLAATDRNIDPPKEEVAINKTKDRIEKRRAPKVEVLKEQIRKVSRIKESQPSLLAEQSGSKIMLQSAVDVKSNKEVIVSDNSLASTEVVLEDSSSHENLVLAAVKADHIDDQSPRERNVKSIGDLVNFVVGKIDKRQDKLIQFSDTDEGSFVTGLNLGFVKIRSRNYKD